MSEKKTLSAEDWAHAALEAISRDGVNAVAVEPLARSLGVTKGSFYWHFANREALLEAALNLWEKQETDDVIKRIGDEPDPVRRIQRVFHKVDASTRTSRQYMALAAAAAYDPLIRDVVTRVSERRLEFITNCYIDLGLSPDDAKRWGASAYSVYLGVLQLRWDLPHALPDEPDSEAYQAYMQQFTRILLPDVVDANRQANVA
ncbi:MAG: TetR/AcrR family transcriptional regulator [Salinisphaeraceae bacterium]|nr:TetR/AcrR family transcriptional regulator [Salinisphaeraceae bacterium]